MAVDHGAGCRGHWSGAWDAAGLGRAGMDVAKWLRLLTNLYLNIAERG